MINLLFSPNGRIGPDYFMRGAIVLIAVTFLINLLSMVNVSLGGAFKILLVVVYYCWFILFIKRYRDAGKSGWMSLVPAMSFTILFVLQSSIIPNVFGGDIYADMQTALHDVMIEGGGIDDLMKISLEYAEPLTKKIALPHSLSFAAMSYFIAWGFNQIIKTVY